MTGSSRPAAWTEEIYRVLRDESIALYWFPTISKWFMSRGPIQQAISQARVLNIAVVQAQYDAPLGELFILERGHEFFTQITFEASLGDLVPVFNAEKKYCLADPLTLTWVRLAAVTQLERLTGDRSMMVEQCQT